MSLAGRLRLFGHLLARTGLIGAGGALALWSAFTLQAYGSQGALDAVGARIRAGEVVRADTLTALEPALAALAAAPVPPPDLLRDAALVRVQQVDSAIAAGATAAGHPAVAAADAAVRTALAATPTDGFLWFALAWLGKVRDGFAPAELPPLAASYLYAPREGWVALHRNALAVTLLPALPPPLQALALDEYRNLVASNYIPAAAALLKGPGWAQRDALLATLAPLSPDTRAAFAQQLGWMGVEADVPGLPRRKGDRPWR